MGNELPDLWWLLSPELIRHVSREFNFGEQSEPQYLVLEHFTEQLVKNGYLKGLEGGRRSLGSSVFDGSYVTYQSKLLQMVSTADASKEKCLVHILLEIPQDADTLLYMQRIVEITKGVKSFVNIRLTFIGFSLTTFTMDL